jgi:CRISPR-associated protein Csm2
MPNGTHRGGRGEQGRGGQRYGGGGGHLEPDIDVGGIDFKVGKIDAELFNSIAKQAAKTIGANKRSNKPTQLRRFYDELVMWSTKVEQSEERFEEYLPFIRMMNAKAAYAKGRDLVDGNFVKLLSHSLGQVDSPKTLRQVKLFFEAFLGFYKEERPRD